MRASFDHEYTPFEVDIARSPPPYDGGRSGPSRAPPLPCKSGTPMVESGGGQSPFSQWISKLHPSLTGNIRLLMANEDASREGAEKGNFANVAQYLLLTSTSVKHLAETLSLGWEELVKRFRPNLVIDTDGSGMAPFSEDHFEEVWIGGSCFEVGYDPLRGDATLLFRSREGAHAVK